MSLNKESKPNPFENEKCNHIIVRRTRHAGHCWRSRDELISDVLLWTPTHGRAKAGRPARRYIQQLCEDTGCCPEDLCEAMNDREKWRERVRDIRATSTTWWWITYNLLYGFKNGDSPTGSQAILLLVVFTTMTAVVVRVNPIYQNMTQGHFLSGV